ncbi:MAG: UDP-2,3-diacylglucosamine diphosphatase LpxI [Candidatus Aminicenantes bacterium]|nr:UDP-2,3-diacylglucosamine diphosphatase LpxI [Candidatus Aminicenantes bacterium]
MGTRIGLIAGGGDFPLQALAEAKKRGCFCAVAALRGAATDELKREADAFEWFGPAELEKLVSFFKSHEIRDAVMLGKVEHRTIFQKDLQDEGLAPLLACLPDRSATTLLQSLIGYLQAHGLAVLDPSEFLAPFFCPEGILGAAAVSEAVGADAAYGWPLAKILADSDIGQTLVVKDRAVVAVEGMDGTDETIRRGANLAGDGVVVLKAGRTRQNARIDMPTVGLETMRTLAKARAAALVIEAARVPFFQKEEALELAARAGVAVLVRR